ncbi:hypothetical protein BV25DRAFT_1823335 [Artomyces pyxidatus]|uniref:Uncharacterized protein n=1 Tax=Artomyces pyxidatus TaxID=48021 RepID=A0ACB8T867_9AGAM|nr:hypothetical protein BV25DRAFT_1823335 [Artomyces pyxidatus]
MVIETDALSRAVTSRHPFRTRAHGPTHGPRPVLECAACGQTMGLGPHVWVCCGVAGYRQSTPWPRTRSPRGFTWAKPPPIAIRIDAASSWHVQTARARAYVYVPVRSAPWQPLASSEARRSCQCIRSSRVCHAKLESQAPSYARRGGGRPAVRPACQAARARTLPRR